MCRATLISVVPKVSCEPVRGSLVSSCTLLLHEFPVRFRSFGTQSCEWLITCTCRGNVSGALDPARPLPEVSHCLIAHHFSGQLLLTLINFCSSTNVPLQFPSIWFRVCFWNSLVARLLEDVDFTKRANYVKFMTFRWSFAKLCLIKIVFRYFTGSCSFNLRF